MCVCVCVCVRMNRVRQEQSEERGERKQAAMAVHTCRDTHMHRSLTHSLHTQAHNERQTSSGV